ATAPSGHGDSPPRRAVQTTLSPANWIPPPTGSPFPPAIFPSSRLKPTVPSGSGGKMPASPPLPTPALEPIHQFKSGLIATGAKSSPAKVAFTLANAMAPGGYAEPIGVANS